MTREAFTTVKAAVVAKIEIDEMQVSGIGDFVYPRLLIPARLHLTRPVTVESSVQYSFTGLWAQLAVKDALGKVADGLPLTIYTIANWEPGETRVEQIQLEFPLDHVRVAHLERVRNGGELTFQLTLQLRVEETGEIKLGAPAASPRQWGLRYLHRLTAQPWITVPHTIWIEKVLPKVGFGKVHVMEFPAAPLRACAELDLAFRALGQAERCHRDGFYDDAVGKCRVALEKFFERREEKGTDDKTRYVTHLAEYWQIKLGRRTYEWLNASLLCVKHTSNRAHHSPNVHFDQVESQMLIAVTAALVSYAARALEVEEMDGTAES